MREADALALFDQCGFAPPAGLTTQEAFELLVDLARKQRAQDAATRPGRGRTAVLPTPPTVDAATAVLAAAGCACAPLAPCGTGQQKRAKFPTSKAHISAVFHSFRLTFGRAIISRNGLEA
jgi:hypothetical protein